MVYKPPRFFGGLPETEKAAKSDEAALETQVVRALTMTDGVEAGDLTVTASGSTIHLGGHVTEVRQIDKAREIAKSIDGVDMIVSHIALMPMGHG